MIARDDVFDERAIVAIGVVASVITWWLQGGLLPRAWRADSRTRVFLLLLNLGRPVPYWLKFEMTGNVRSRADGLRILAFLASTVLLEAWVIWRTRRVAARPGEALFGWWRALAVASLSPVIWVAWASAGMLVLSPFERIG